ncbi:MAG: GNAT family N-acetyltransferase [Patescibacteria group bacterium]
MLNFKEGTKKGAVKYWHAYDGDKRIGYAYIIESQDPNLGKYFLINVFMNKTSQRKGYGSQLFSRIAILSGLNMLYAKSSKSNTGSYKAALKAGYSEIIKHAFKQRVMIWKKN